MTDRGRVRLLLADEDATARDVVARVVGGEGGFEIVGSVGDAAAAVRTAVAERPDLCLLDVRLPGSGIAAVWEIAARVPETRVVMFTASDSDDDLFAALRGGATGYLLKDMDLTRLPDALRDASAGRTAMPRRLVARLVDRYRGPEARRRTPVGELPTGERLTSREWQVVELLAEGLSTREIASRLVLSASTVRVHVAAIVRKSGARDRHDAAARFRGGRSGI